MGKPLTTDQLVASMTRRAMLPVDGNVNSGSSGGLTKSDYIDILNEEMSSGLLTHLLSTHEEYLVRFTEYTLTSDKRGYDIPERAIGNKLRGVFLLDSGNNMYELTRVDLQDAMYYQNNSNVSYNNNCFHVIDNQIEFLSSNISGISKLRMYYYMRPSTLVEDKYAAIVQSMVVGPTTTDIIVNKVPTTFQSGMLLDITGAKSPNRLQGFDIVPTNINNTANIITINNSDIPSSLLIGDYITLAQESIVPQVPTELHALLAQRGAVAALEALGDTEGLTNARAKLGNIESKTLDLIDNRTETNVQKINNMHGPLRQLRKNHRRIR